MKKTLSLLLCLLLLAGLAACGKEDGKDAEEPTAEATTVFEYNGPSLDEMSPPSMDTTLPLELPVTYAAIDKSAFLPIKAADSAYWPETTAKSVYRSGSDEYFIMDDGAVRAILADAGSSALYSAYYDKEGRLSFIGDDNAKNWFFTTDGAFDYMVYTYTLENGAQVVSFYEGENSRFAVYAGQTYYDGELNEISEEQKIKLVTRVAAAFSMMGGMDAL